MQFLENFPRTIAQCCGISQSIFMVSAHMPLNDTEVVHSAHLDFDLLFPVVLSQAFPVDKTSCLLHSQLHYGSI